MSLNYNGKITTWEEIAAGRVFQRIFGELSSDTPPEVWEEVANRIKAGLQPLIAFTQPDVVVVGGSVGSVHILFFRYFKRSSSRKLTRRHISTKNNQRP